MNGPLLSLDLFIKDQSDFELRQYEVLAALKKISVYFRHNSIYPHLNHLIEAQRTLSGISNRLKDLRNKFPKRIEKIDFVNQKIEHSVIFIDGSDLGQVEKLIDWALPHIEAKIEEGKTIYEFVNKAIELEEVGIVPNYTDEGYFFVPDNGSSELLLFQYEVSIFKSPETKYRSLKTNLLKTLKQSGAHFSSNALKLGLIDEYKDLPNPATYSFQTHLHFPFEETIFPIVKRRLMEQLVN